MTLSLKAPMLLLSLVLCLSVEAAAPAATAHKKHHAAGGGVDGDRALVVHTCQACHDINIVARAQHTSAEWPNIVRRMLSHGADISDESFDKIVHYLAGKKPGTV